MANKKLNATITIGGAVSSSLKGAFGTVKNSMSDIGKAISDLDRKNKTLANAIQTFGREGKNVDALRQKYKENAAAVDQLTASHKRLQEIANAQNENDAALENYKKQILEIVALGASVAATVKQAIDFESTMADIKKVVDFDTANGFTEMGKTIIDMSRRLPMTAADIGKIVAAGGQSGIATKDLTSFAEAAIKMGVAFDVSAEEAGQAMAEMRSAFGMTQEQVNTLADQMNYLDNNGSAAAKDIMEIVQRIGPLAKVAGVSAGQVAALGSTLRGMGVQNEIAATGIKNLFLTLSSGKSATKGQREVFKQLGYTSTEVAKSMQLDARKTMTVILKQIGKLKKADQAAALSTLFGKEVVGSIAPLLTNLDQLEKNFDAVADSTKFAGSMQKEFDARAATTTNQLILFKNQITALAITVGGVLLPPLNAFLKTVGPIIGKMADFADANPMVTKVVIGTTAAIIGLRLATYSAGFAFTYLKGVSLRLAGALAGARAQAALTAVATRLLGASSAAASGGLIGMATRAIPAVITGIRGIGIAFISTGIGALVAGLAIGGLWIYRNWAGVKAFMVGTLEGIQQGLQPLIDNLTTLWNNLGPVKTAFEWVGGAIAKVWDWFTKLVQPVTYSGEELKKAGDAGQEFGKALAAGINFVTAPLQWLIEKITWVVTNMDTLKNKAVDFKNSVSDMAGGAWQKTKDFFSNPFGDDAPQGNTLATPQTPASALPAPALANRGGSTYTDSSTTTIQVTQRPGENNADLAKRIADEQERRRQVRQRSMMNDGVVAP